MIRVTVDSRLHKLTSGPYKGNSSRAQTQRTESQWLAGYVEVRDSARVGYLFAGRDGPGAEWEELLELHHRCRLGTNVFQARKVTLYLKVFPVQNMVWESS